MRKRNNEIVSESYLIAQFENKLAHKMAIIMKELGGGRSGSHVHQAGEHHWRMNVNKDNRKLNRIGMSEHRYDPTQSNIEYGVASVIEDDKVKVDGFSRVIDNSASSVDTEVEISETVTLHKESTHELNAEVHFDVTSTTTVTGAYGGAEIEQALETSFGTSFETNNSETEGKDVEQSINTSVAVPAGKKIQVSFEKNKIVTEQPFTVKGILEFRIDINFEDWARNKFLWHHRRGSKHLTFTNLLEFEQFIEGYNTDFPQMRTFLDECSEECYEAIKWIFDDENRVIEAKGVKRREYDDNINLVTKEVF